MTSVAVFPDCCLWGGATDDDGTGTLARHCKKSFDWYAQVIAINGVRLTRGAPVTARRPAPAIAKASAHE